MEAPTRHTTAAGLLATLKSRGATDLPDDIFAFKQAGSSFKITEKAGTVTLYIPCTSMADLDDPTSIIATHPEDARRKLEKLYRPQIPGTTHILSGPFSRSVYDTQSSRWVTQNKFLGRNYSRNTDGIIVFHETAFIDTEDPHLIKRAVKTAGSLPTLGEHAVLNTDHDLPFYFLKQPFNPGNFKMIGYSKTWKSRRKKAASHTSTRIYNAGIIPSWAFEDSKSSLKSNPLLPRPNYYTSRYSSYPSYTLSRKYTDITLPLLSYVVDYYHLLFKHLDNINAYNTFPNDTWTNNASNWISDRPYIFTLRKIPAVRDALIESLAPFTPYMPHHTPSSLASNPNFTPRLRKTLLDPSVPLVINNTLAFNTFLLGLARVLGLTTLPGDTTPPHELNSDINYLGSDGPTVPTRAHTPKESS